MNKSRQEQLYKIKESILKQNICPELAASATQLVFGDGSPDAEVVFIGEAPGKNEDQQGLPFVGAAGKFLNEMLADIGMKRADVYITNIVKYRPPHNRDPFPDEKAEFLPFLNRQLMAIGPKLIVTLGRHSLEAFLPGASISQIHGQPKRIKVKNTRGLGVDAMQDVTTSTSSTWVVLPLFHPAAALYNGAMRQTLVQDFLRIPRILAQIQ